MAKQTTKATNLGVAKISELGVTAKTPTREVIALLNAKIESLKHIQESVFKVLGNGNLEGFGDLSKETSVPKLIKAYSMISGKEKAYYASADELGLGSVEVFTVNGGNSEAWKADIKLRIEIINFQETFNELTSLRDQYEKFLSEEDQKESLLEKIAAVVSKA